MAEYDGSIIKDRVYQGLFVALRNSIWPRIPETDPTANAGAREPVYYQIDHGRGHLRRVCGTMTVMLKAAAAVPNPPHPLEPADRFVALAAAAFHDLGMHFGWHFRLPNVSEPLSRENAPLVRKEHAHIGADFFRAVRGGNLPGELELTPGQQRLLAKQALNEQLAFMIEAHVLPPADLETALKSAYPDHKDQELMRFLVCLLQAADTLDMDARRVSPGHLEAGMRHLLGEPSEIQPTLREFFRWLRCHYFHRGTLGLLKGTDYVLEFTPEPKVPGEMCTDTEYRPLLDLLKAQYGQRLQDQSYHMKVLREYAGLRFTTTVLPDFRRDDTKLSLDKGLLAKLVAEMDRVVDRSQVASPADREGGPVATGHTLSQVPLLPEAFLPRPEHSDAILKLLNQHRVVAVVGLPGIGKTELCKAVAGEIERSQPDRRVLYLSVEAALPPDLLRARLAAALGRSPPPESDAQLAAWLNEQPTLLVLDNLEAAMIEAAGQEAIARQLEALAHAPNLRLLLATRWLAGMDNPRENSYSIPPMPPEQTATMLRGLLERQGVFDPRWLVDPAWEQLLTFLDGHPRSVSLVAQHFAEPGFSLVGMVERLQSQRERAVIDPALMGRADLSGLDAGQRQRMKSLVASMDFSFQVLRTRHPEAARAFCQLSLFPAGLPESVAWAVTGGRERLVLEPLYRYHLLEWRRQRVFYPVPLRWYAERQAQDDTDLAAARPLLLGQAVTAYAAYMENLHHAHLQAQSVETTAQWLAEESTLLWLTEQACSPKSGDTSSWGRLAAAGQNLFQATNRLQAWRELTRHGLADATARGDRRNQANCLRSLGDLAIRTGALTEADQYYHQALTIFRDIQHRLGEANCLKSMGNLAMHQNNPTEAARCYQQALPIFRNIQDRLGEANCLAVLGLVCDTKGDASGARRHFGAALALFREIEGRWGEQAVLGYLARLHAGETPRLALVLAGHSLTIGRRIQDRFGQTITLSLMLELSIEQQAWPEALEVAIVLGEMAREIGENRALAQAEAVLAALRPPFRGPMPTLEQAWQGVDAVLAEVEYQLTAEEHKVLREYIPV
ncbi:MAG: tetratricopeptide repeat protein [Magnetococcales bacterium]|nr:tetratricopeptide repeat protein [Magnetococcales bacterium]